MRQATILYDGDCGFCRWTLGLLLTWDRQARLRPATIQGPEGEAALAGMDPECRLDSWHLVGPHGEVRSAGEAVPALMRLLPAGAAVAALTAALPGPTEAAYRFVARHRGTIGRRLPRSAVDWAGRRIAEHAARGDRDSRG